MCAAPWYWADPRTTAPPPALMEAFWLLSDKDKESVESVDIINLAECLRQFLNRLGQIIYKYSKLGRGTASEDDIKKTVQQRTIRL